MRYAISVPNFGEYFDARLVADLAARAEALGWDACFVWDHVHAAFEPGTPLADPWVLLTAVALSTERMRIGTMVTPLARRRPWQVARQTVTLDHLSGGRMVLGVGLGYPADLEFAALGEDPDDRVRAARLDECLEVIVRLWNGDPVDFEGEHYRLHGARFGPRPLQQPRIPIWVGCMWPNRAPMRRAARWDGFFPIDASMNELSPPDLEEALAYVRSHRPAELADAPFEVSLSGSLPLDRAEAREHLAPYAAAGVDWWHLTTWGVDDLRSQIEAGPPSS